MVGDSLLGQRGQSAWVPEHSLILMVFMARGNGAYWNREKREGREMGSREVACVQQVISFEGSPRRIFSILGGFKSRARQLAEHTVELTRRSKTEPH